MSRIPTYIPLVIASCWLVSSAAYGQADFPPGPLFIEEFNDGNFSDGDPIAWQRGVWAPGAQDFTNGEDLLVTTEGISFFAIHDGAGQWLGYDNFTIQTQVRIETVATDFTFAGIAGRSPDLRLYYVGVNAQGALVVGESFNDGRDPNVLADLDTGIDPTATDVVLRFDFDGPQMRAWVWEAEAGQPSSPNFIFTDESLTYGTLGTLVNAGGPGAQVAYRWFEVSETLPIPEPSGLILIGVAGLIACTRRSRPARALQSSLAFQVRHTAKTRSVTAAALYLFVSVPAGYAIEYVPFVQVDFDSPLPVDWVEEVPSGLLDYRPPSFFGPGVREIRDGKYILQSETDEQMFASVPAPPLHSVRMRARLLDVPTGGQLFFNIEARNSAGDKFALGGIDQTGLAVTGWFSTTDGFEVTSAASGVNPFDWTELRLDVAPEGVRFWAWQDGASQPIDPTITFPLSSTIDPYELTFAGMDFNPRETLNQPRLEVDQLEVFTSVPEPGSSAMALMGSFLVYRFIVRQ